MTDRSYAEIFEVFRCKILQQVSGNGILAKRRLILFEAKLAQPGPLRPCGDPRLRGAAAPHQQR